MNNRRRLDMATANAAAFWTALGTSRGHDVVQREAFLAVISRTRIPNRVLLLSADPSAADLAEIRDLVHSDPERATVVEDPYSTVDASGTGLHPRPMPVMARTPRRVEPKGDRAVTAALTPDQLRVAEATIVHGFPLARAQPYVEGEVLPDALLDHPGFEAFVITNDDEPVGACVTMTAATCVGVYWVTTMPAHRSKGVARGLMTDVLHHHAKLPVTLDASVAGKPLYDSMGFEVVADSTWWM